MLAVDILPLRIEQHGIDKIHSGIGIHLINDLINHTIGILLDPVIDIPQRFFIKGRLVDRGTIVVSVSLQEILFHRKAAVLEPDGIGQRQLCLFTGWQTADIGMEIFVEFTDWDVPAQQGFHLSKGLALGTVCGHGKRQHDRQRRNQAVFSFLPHVLEQADGEVCRSVFEGVICRPSGSLLRRDALHQVIRLHLYGAPSQAQQPCRQQRQAKEYSNPSFFLHHKHLFPFRL